MFGAIVGDVIGSAYEFTSFKTTDFPLCFLESRDFEHAVRLAISLGGSS